MVDNIAEDAAAFPLKKARSLVRDLAKPKPWIYWTDFLFHIILGWAAFITALLAPIPSVLGIAAYFVASLCLYRAVIFTHELSHLKKGTFKGFRFVWNILCGFPLMAPSFMYHGVHNDHHARDIYGTTSDGEYLPFASQNPSKIVGYLLLIFILPIFFAVRFLILAPLSWVIPPLRRFVWERASSLTIDLAYRRPALSKRDDPTSWLQEVATSIYAWTITGLLIIGIIPLRLISLWYLVLVLVFLLNSLRTLAAHAYRNPGTQAMSVSEQFQDSVDVPGHVFVTALWAPVGLRYHATHHLFPGMPYHSLGAAHRRLVTQLPDNKPYLKATRKSLWHALETLLRDASHTFAMRNAGRYPPELSPSSRPKQSRKR